jgi:hypothetical protein
MVPTYEFCLKVLYIYIYIYIYMHAVLKTTNVVGVRHMTDQLSRLWVYPWAAFEQ